MIDNWILLMFGVIGLIVLGVVIWDDDDHWGGPPLA